MPNNAAAAQNRNGAADRPGGPIRARLRNGMDVIPPQKPPAQTVMNRAMGTTPATVTHPTKTGRTTRTGSSAGIRSARVAAYASGRMGGAPGVWTGTGAAAARAPQAGQNLAVAETG